MNAHMEDFFRLEAAEGMPFHHIHGVGKSGYPAMTQRLRQDGLEDLAGLDVREYIYDMAPVMRAADLVICRAGASTISEITALATPAILVPSPLFIRKSQLIIRLFLIRFLKTESRMPTDRKIHIVVSGIVHFPFHDQAVFFENICNDQFKIKGIYFFCFFP